MLKSEKEELIKELNEKFSRAKTAIVAEFTKLDVETVTKLRKKFREGERRVQGPEEHPGQARREGHVRWRSSADDFTGPVALAISYDDVVAPAKILTEFIKDLETIKVRSAVVEGKKIDANGREGAGEDAGSARAARADARHAQPAGRQAGPDDRGPGSQLARVHPGARGQSRPSNRTEKHYHRNPLGLICPEAQAR